MTPEITRYRYTNAGCPMCGSNLCLEDDAGEEIVRIPNIGSLHKLITTEIVDFRRYVDRAGIAVSAY